MVFAWRIHHCKVTRTARPPARLMGAPLALRSRADPLPAPTNRPAIELGAKAVASPSCTSAQSVTPGLFPGRRRCRRFPGPVARCWAWRCRRARPRRLVVLATWCRGRWRQGPLTHRAWLPTRRTGQLKPDLPVAESPLSSQYRCRHPLNCGVPLASRGAGLVCYRPRPRGWAHRLPAGVGRFVHARMAKTPAAGRFPFVWQANVASAIGTAIALRRLQTPGWPSHPAPPGRPSGPGQTRRRGHRTPRRLGCPVRRQIVWS